MTSQRRTSQQLTAPLLSSRRRGATSIAIAALAVAGLAACGAQGEEQDRSDVGVQLFQWTWDSIATECTDVLGPAGFDWVLTSPPQEHVLGEEWWTAYQPVSYQVESRLGTREEFAAMVSTCADAGVDVIADAVINHMSGKDGAGVGWAGTEYSHYDYPGLYSESDFHHCGLTANDDISDYKDADQVQTCELVNLADLDTASPHVREQINAYLTDLLDLGVAGFRIDAAKHIPTADVAAIVAELPEGTRILQEVIGASGEPILPKDYVANGQVFDFMFARNLTMNVKNGLLGDVLDLGAASTGLESDEAIVFVDNHDTERNSETLNYSKPTYSLAMITMLAGPYGTPVILSSYDFPTLEPGMGPLQDSDGAVLPAQCPELVGPDVERTDGEWVCQHRWQAVSGMVGWRITAGDAEITDRVEESGMLAFRRGDAVVLLNGSSEAVEFTYPTTLESGEYCDVITGNLVDEACTGTTVSVGGEITVSVPARGAVGRHAGARL